MDEIDFKKLAGSSNLFLDFLSFSQPARGYYRYDYRNYDSYRQVAEKIDQFPYQREKLAAIISDGFSSDTLPEHTRRNIEKLANPNSLAVFAGQQVGLLLGPMYTVLKALTAYKLAQKLEAELGRPVVPCFWMATDDHDFDEIKSASFLDREGVCRTLTYEPQKRLQNAPVADVCLDLGINTFLEEVESALLPTEFSDDVKNLIKNAYLPERPVGEAFADLFNKLLGRLGIVPVDPNSPGMKELFMPVFEREIKEHETIFDIFESRSQEIIESGYHRQVHKAPESLNLFFSDGIRRNIIIDGSNFSLDGYDKSFQENRLLEMLHTSPEKFSPNVTLRPIAQSLAFPTISQIVGPSEAAYFAQIGPLFDYHKVPWPVIRPRMFASIIEPHIAKIVSKLSIDFIGLANDTEHEIARVIIENYPPQIMHQAEDLRPQIEKPLLNLAGSLEKNDHDSYLAIEHARRRIDHELNHLSKKLLALHRKKHDDARKKVNKVASFLLPCGKYQERVISPIYFANKFGPDIFEWLEKSLELDVTGHQLVDVKV